ncbi:MAG: hypothetical protein SF187_21820 [Deltaproteobacteria bacterium]|nr:hypothetical protein [Deltaproteobacteria bacterium]
MNRPALYAALLTVLWASHASADALSSHEAIAYERQAATDPVSRLAQDLAASKRKLSRDRTTGYLRSLLAELSIPESSQTLVFSKTSFQRDLITPNTPRALFFNDNVYVGYVADGAVLEVASVDPVLGATFYVLDQRAASPAPERRHEDCLRCHESGMTDDAPGFLLRSVFVNPEGHPALSEGSFLTKPDSPFEQRWGGWYVTGTHGRSRHMGNSVLQAGQHNETFDRETGANVKSLQGRFAARSYLQQSSDIVALLVLEHQSHVHNMLTRANYHTRIALADNRVVNQALGHPPDDLREATRHRIEGAVEPLVRAMVMADEAPLPDAVAGTSAFAADFQRRGPFDGKGRSLRQMDLKRRVFALPLSYLIYSPALDGLPPLARTQFWQRLCAVLNGNDPLATHLSPAERNTVLQILRDTKPGAPACR